MAPCERLEEVDNEELLAISAQSLRMNLWQGEQGGPTLFFRGWCRHRPKGSPSHTHWPWVLAFLLGLASPLLSLCLAVVLIPPPPGFQQGGRVLCVDKATLRPCSGRPAVSGFYYNSVETRHRESCRNWGVLQTGPGQSNSHQCD